MIRWTDLDAEPLTGNSLLYPHGQQRFPEAATLNDVNPRLSVKVARDFVNQFWETWLRNMPPTLMLRSKWFRPRNNLKIGDYVIVLEPGMKGKTAPRGLSEHAVVSKTFPGKDGLVRKVELRLSGQRTLTRPFHKLSLIATAEELSSCK